MKHKLTVTFILLGMFILTQLIGLFIVDAYSPKTIEIDGELQNVTPKIPYGMQSPEVDSEVSLVGIIFAFIVAILLVLLLTKFRAAIIMKIWFFIVVVLALGISFNAIIPGGTRILFSSLTLSETLAIAVALPLAYIKVFKQNILVHNFTELFIYPGIAAIFVPILSVWSIIILLILISLYDMYAVWHAGFMQKMAKYQIEELKVFSGFFVPYLGKGQREQVQKLKKEDPEKLKTKKIKVNLAILGGGDVVFPIITAGVLMTASGWGIIPALLSLLGATLGLSYLFFFAEKGKFYPAMPFITAGIFLGILVGWLIV
jgi:presenilin-like A22 family membrane protease